MNHIHIMNMHGRVILHKHDSSWRIVVYFKHFIIIIKYSTHIYTYILLILLFKHVSEEHKINGQSIISG